MFAIRLATTGCTGINSDFVAGGAAGAAGTASVLQSAEESTAEREDAAGAGTARAATATVVSDDSFAGINDEDFVADATGVATDVAATATAVHQATETIKDATSAGAAAAAAGIACATVVGDDRFAGINDEDFVADAAGVAADAAASQTAKAIKDTERKDAASTGIACATVVNDDRFTRINCNFVAGATGRSTRIATQVADTIADTEREDAAAAGTARAASATVVNDDRFTGINEDFVAGAAGRSTRTARINQTTDAVEDTEREDSAAAGTARAAVVNDDCFTRINCDFVAGAAGASTGGQSIRPQAGLGVSRGQ